MKYLFTFLFFSFTLVYSQTTIPAGNVSGIWTASGSPYNVTGEITVPDGQSLTIEPAVVVNFTGWYKFIVSGKITAIGTAVNPITFTCPDTSVSWRGLRFPLTSSLNDSSIFVHCVIEGGKNLSGTGDEAYGGGVFIRAFSKVRFTECLFRYNKANYGGAVSVRDNVNIIIENCTFTDNYARYSGAAIRLHDYSHAVIRNNKIFNNTGSGGPGLYCYRSNPEVINNYFYNNISTGSGGAINLDTSSPILIDNLFTGNSAVNGGAVYFAALSSPQFTNNTIANNNATNGGALYFSNSSNPTFTNCVVWGNTASWGTQVYLANDLSDPNFLNCFMQHGTLNFYGTGSGANYSGTYANNIEVDPQFMGSGDHPFCLSETSPGINKGTPDVTGLNLPPLDLAGNPRIDADTVDIGCYEFQSNITTTFQLTVSIQNSWNMVSIPGLHPLNQNVITWWEYKDPGAGVFKFQSGYQAITAAVPGTGYWMKHSGDRIYNTGDEWPAGGIIKTAHNSIACGAGWNLIGGYDESVSAAGITTTPPGLISGPVYKYSSGYLAASTIDPGYGYWVKLTEAGQINIPSGSAGKSETITTAAEDFGRIIISDNNGKSYTLFTSSSLADLSSFELPPLPPQGMFDVRFSSQRFVESLNHPQTIEVRGAENPVNIKAEGIGIIISDESGLVLERLKTGEEISLQIMNNKLIVSTDIIPDNYSLEQNYPNPFNPVTTIQFSIMEDVQHAKLIIYNSLGEKITELINSALKAGYYNYKWDAGNLASGTYIYQLITEKFVFSKKMILLK